jgi:uncharacterized protein (TIGR03437 family)
MRLLPLLLLTAAPIVAQPVIKGLQNNYSYILPGVPNYGIAEGSIFIITGSGLANASTGLQSTYPLPTTLMGTSVSVTVSGATTTPILYYVLPTQIGAILPSATPVGTGMITVINNGQTSASFPIQVVQSAFGILTYYGSGSGFAAVFDDNFPVAASPYVTLSAAANPGEVLTVWGSGIGPDPGNPNETIPQKSNNLAGSLPIEVDIGGISSTILYAGRSIYPGLDQINVSVPPNVTPGCHVSLIVKTGSYVSNSTTIAVAQNGRTCTDPNVGYTVSQLETISMQKTINVGIIGFGQNIVDGTLINGLNAFFYGYSQQEFLTQEQAPSYNSCLIRPTVPTPPYLDAGAAIKITGPGGESATIERTPGTIYFGGVTSSFISKSGGSFSFSNGPGGTNVGAFNTSITLPPEVTWTNMSAASTVNRSQGLTITWSGGTPGTFVEIDGTAPTTDGSLTQEFTCAAPASAGQMTVPPSVLLAMPAASNGQLIVYTYALPVAFTATGLDAGFVAGELISGFVTATYK